MIWSTIEINVAIICASLLVMKPLFARFIPAMVSEQPVSAREDARVWNRLTGLGLLEASIGDGGDEDKAEYDARRDTAVAMSVRSGGEILVPKRVWDGRGKSGGRVRWSW